MAFLEWLEYSAFSDWGATSEWGYPMMITAHSVGMAIIIGLLFVLNLRLLGAFQQIPIASLRSLLKLAWTGFVINLGSGISLFISQATFFATHVAFLVKIAAIFLALINAAFIQQILRQQAGNSDGGGVTIKMKILAVSSLTLWLTAIIAGRLVAYI